MLRYVLAALVVGLAVPAAADTPPEVPEGAFAAGALDEGDPRVEARLLVDEEAVAPGGDVRVGVLFTIDPDWHIYWRNSGDSGLSTQVVFDAPSVVFDELRWPAPTVFREAGGMLTTYGYPDEVLLYSRARVDDTATGAVTFEASIDYLVCDESCIPGRATLTRAVPVEAQARPADAAVSGLFDTWEARVPRRPDEAGLTLEMALSQTAVRPGDEFDVALGVVSCVGPPEAGETCADWRAPSDATLAFVPDRIDSVALEVTGEAVHPGVFAGRVIGLHGTADADDPGGDERLVGVLYLESPDDGHLTLCVDEVLPRARPGEAVEAVDSPLLSAVVPADEGISAVPPAAGGEPHQAGLGFFMALLYAFLGGIILNVMPCVFPVLSIKVLSLVETVQKHRSQIVGHGMAYTLGILTSMWALAGVVIAVQSGGDKLGWGFQFQQPLFVAIVAGLLVVFAMWLFGTFEVSVTAGRLGAVADQASGYRRSFFEGVLAVILATPCAGPFLGVAAGFALASAPPTTFAMFTGIGLGLAFPFVLLTLIPKLAAMLPRPGRWMEIVKQFFAFSVLGTVVWLFSVMGSLAGASGMVKLLAFLLAVGAATWLAGLTQGARPRRRAVGLLLAVAILLTTGFRSLRFEPEPEGPIAWGDWTEEAVAAELAEGRPVLVDFTADWCVTCQATEALVIGSDRVVSALQDNDVAAFRADWTAPDERIRAKLAEFGRGGVPMYLVYSPARPSEPLLLPEVISVDLLVNALEAAADGQSPGAI